MGNVLLETKGLHRFFGGLHAVDDVSITVSQGTIKGVIGPNGAGKSNLIEAIIEHSATGFRPTACATPL